MTHGNYSAKPLTWQSNYSTRSEQPVFHFKLEGVRFPMRFDHEVFAHRGYLWIDWIVEPPSTLNASLANITLCNISE